MRHSNFESQFPKQVSRESLLQELLEASKSFCYWDVIIMDGTSFTGANKSRLIAYRRWLVAVEKFNKFRMGIE